jgi:cytochrome c peroxidase
MKRLLTTIAAFAVLMFAAGAALGDVGLTPLEQLGKFIYFDKISSPESMSCADCHAANVGFTGPVGGINKHGAVYRGAVPKRFGNRKPPAAAYASFSPILHYDTEEGLIIGGNFWDGRATGERLGNPTVEQALGPFLNPVEQNMPDSKAVLEKIAASKYAWLWAEVWGSPISVATPHDIAMNYDRVGLSVGAFEASREVNQFSSKFDVFWFNAVAAGKDVAAINMWNWLDYAGLGLGDDELLGLALYADEDKGKCALCHVLTSEGTTPPLFTDFTFDNLGVPKNPENPFYRMDKVYLDDGSPINPQGKDWIDPGLGGFLQTRPDYAMYAAENWGKHKVPTLRNVDKRPGGKNLEPFLEDVDMPAPEGLPKAYMHNGVFKSLKEVVHFYNTRDVEDWPAPEVADNVNTDELGNLGLTAEEEDLIVLFMRTLSDGYTVPWDGMMLSNASSSLDVSGPNPFNPSTTIRFALFKAGNVRIDAYNVAGQHVSTLVNAWKDAGEHRVVFDANSLPSGVYFIRLTTTGSTLTTKAVLLK